MPIVSVTDNGDNENNRWKRNSKTKNKARKEKGRRCRSYSEKVRTKWSCCTFKLGCLQLICKAFLISKSNLKLALSIILKQRELYKSKHVVVECRMFKNMRLVILFDMFLNPSFKMKTSFANIARTTASTSKFIY